MHAAGSREARGIVVQVTDETGTPVPGATVSFRLPDEGATGVFGNGLRTDVMVTGTQGRVALHNLEFGRTPGQLQLRITAAKGDARAGIVSLQTIAARGAAQVYSGAIPPASSSSAMPPPNSRSATQGWTPGSSKDGFVESGAGDSHRKRWILIGLVLAAGAAGGGVFALRARGSSVAASSSNGTLPPNIGAPTITIGHP